MNEQELSSLAGLAEALVCSPDRAEDLLEMTDFRRGSRAARCAKIMAEFVAGKTFKQIQAGAPHMEDGDVAYLLRWACGCAERQRR